MHTYQAKVVWQRNEQLFSDNQYSRGHHWEFDGGLTVPASSSPLSVPLPMSVAANVDPEEALVAALASCHMLFFLAFACKQGLVIDTYEDLAVASMEKIPSGKMAITRIVLHPKTTFSGGLQPDSLELEKLHHLAHEHCYIANSLKAEISIEPVV